MPNQIVSLGRVMGGVREPLPIAGPIRTDAFGSVVVARLEEFSDGPGRRDGARMISLPSIRRDQGTACAGLRASLWH
ncbi:hypothetical protein NL676_000539 [Syzygium grande]|nr:hypothetical protein NL676_000539 [Syzygium grande]